MRSFHLAISSSVESGRKPLADMDLNADITDLRWTTGATGYLDLECGLAAGSLWPVIGYLPTPVDIPFRAHVEVGYGSRVVYEGRVRRRRRGPGGLFTGFTAEGYLAHLGDNWNRSTATSSVQSGAALQQVAQSTSPFLRFGNAEQFVEPAVTHSGGLNEFRRMTAGEVADQLIKEGNSNGQPVDVAVWERLTLWCLPRTAPTSPHYRIPFDPGLVAWEEDCGRMASHATVEYGDGVTGTLTAEAETSGFLDAWGFTRKVLIPAGDISAVAGLALRDRTLTDGATPEITALISLEDGEGLRLFSGVEQPQELVRALEWVQVGTEPLQVIVGTTHDATARSLAVELGNPSPYLPRNQNIRETLAVARLVRKIDPTSGGRTR